MSRTKSIALAFAVAAGLAAAGSVVRADDAQTPAAGDARHAKGAHKEGRQHGHGMQRMGEKHERMGDMHKRMEKHGQDAGKQQPKQPEGEEHKH